VWQKQAVIVVTVLGTSKVYGNTRFQNDHNALSPREVHSGLRFKG